MNHHSFFDWHIQAKDFIVFMSLKFRTEYQNNL